MSDARVPPSDDGAHVADEPESHPDDFELEISDLRRHTRAGASSAASESATPWYRQRVQVPRPLVIAALGVILGLILLLATPIGSALRAFGTRPTPTADPIVQIVYPTAPPPTVTPYPTPTLVAPAVGSVPANCPPGDPLVDFAPTAFIPGVRGGDVWVVGLVGPDGKAVSGQRATAKIGGPQAINSAYTSAGWPIQIMVLAKTDFAQTVTITGRDLRTGYSLWFSPDSNNPGAIAEAAPIATIDFSASTGPSTSDGQWKIWFGVLYLPGAGCYTLQANWPGDGWVVNFAAGR
jgi:hypothetical protein